MKISSLFYMNLISWEFRFLVILFYIYFQGPHGGCHSQSQEPKELPFTVTKSSFPMHSHTMIIIEHLQSVVIGILLQSTARYNGVKQHQPRLVLGWVTVLVCQFLLIVLCLSFIKRYRCGTRCEIYLVASD